MRKHRLSHFKWLIFVEAFICCAFYSCINDDWLTETATHSKSKNEELTVAVARQWYESQYAPVVTMRSSPSDPTERLLKPDWTSAKERNRMRYEVVETQIRVKGNHLVVDEETNQKWQPSVQAKFVRNLSRMVILQDKKTKKNRSFIMTFIGSYEYLQRTRTFNKNSYLYREPDFDGAVMFYELNGSFINGWKYSNGRIVATISKLSKNTVPTTRAMVESCTERCYTYHDQICDDYVSIEDDAEYGSGWVVGHTCIPVSYQECYNECSYYDDGVDDNSDNNWNGNYPPGGAGSTDNNNNQKPEPDIKSCTNINQVKQTIPAKLKALGINLDGINITEKEECTSNLRAENGNIIVCTQFYNRPLNDQVAMFGHEVFHIRNHNTTKSWPDPEPINPPIYLGDPPKDIYEHIKAKFSDYYTGELLEFYIKDFITTSTTILPEYYSSEIEAYTYEKEIFTNVSDEYAIEREYSLWQNQQKYQVAKDHFKQ